MSLQIKSLPISIYNATTRKPKKGDMKNKMSISYGIKTFFYGSIKLHVHHLNLVNVSNIEYSFYNRDQKC